ncbi:hypothetical protein LXA43DRAFT_377654 [Ganoderma leucocontextum]|nr:hypothetical protein LXA43DRAFT_377654 [Ganoderma leucocontextum]
MTPRKTRSNKPPADPNQPPNGRRSDPDPVEPTSSFGKGKNPRKRSPDRDEEPGTAPPLKKRVSNRRPPSSAHPSPAAKRAASRRSTRKISRPSKKDVTEPADPDPDVIVIEEDGCPYVVYDDAPHFHPPPQRYTQSDTGQLSTSPEQVKGCSIKPCWRPTQQRRCRILQADEAVEEIGWKKVRKWMQAVRCRLCGETQVLRDLTKGCFNLEHWWRHLRVRHGIKREEEIEEKGEEKYKALPIKGHVCVGACSTCGESGAAASPRQRNPSTRHGRGAKRRDGSAAEFSDLNSLSSVDTMRNPPRESTPNQWRPSLASSLAHQTTLLERDRPTPTTLCQIRDSTPWPTRGPSINANPLVPSHSLRCLDPEISHRWSLERGPSTSTPACTSAPSLPCHRHPPCQALSGRPSISLHR